MTRTANVTYGTGKLRNCIKNGKRTTECVLTCCGIHTSLRGSPQPDGTAKSNIGTERSAAATVYIFGVSPREGGYERCKEDTTNVFLYHIKHKIVLNRIFLRPFFLSQILYPALANISTHGRVRPLIPHYFHMNKQSFRYKLCVHVHKRCRYNNIYNA